MGVEPETAEKLFRLLLKEGSLIHVGGGLHFHKEAMERLRKLVQDNVKGAHCDVNIFDGEEHSYLELGGWIGDQGFALMLMGLGTLLGLWKLLTPRTMLPAGMPEDLIMEMAGSGMVAIKAE